jgi:hypothetical protein
LRIALLESLSSGYRNGCVDKMGMMATGVAMLVGQE